MAQSLLIYGATDSFKTSNCAEYVEWIYTRYGGVTRGVFGDNYGPVRKQIQDGLLDAWDMTQETDPLACIILASQGWWPEKIVDGRAVAVGKQKEPRLVKDDFAGVSAYLIEGFKENADLIHRLMERKHQSTGEPLSGEHTAKTYGQTLDYACSSRGTYGFTQNQTHRYFKLGFKGLPVPWVAVTSHDYANKKAGVYGVAVTGMALARTAPQWFDHTLHFEKVIGTIKVQGADGKMIEVLRAGSRAWFAAHAIDNVRWPAKLGVEPWLMDQIYQKWPHGYVPLIMQGSGENWQYVSSVRNLLEMIDPMPEQVAEDEQLAEEAETERAAE